MIKGNIANEVRELAVSSPLPNLKLSLSPRKAPIVTPKYDSIIARRTELYISFLLIMVMPSFNNLGSRWYKNLLNSSRSNSAIESNNSPARSYIAVSKVLDEPTPKSVN